MKIKKEHTHMFLLVLFFGWFYSGIAWLIFEGIGFFEYFEIVRPWDWAFSSAIGYALTSVQAASVVYDD
jgi:hypothetical protein